MFDRRLKIVLFLLTAMVLVLLARAAQVQIFNRAFWRQEAASAMRRTHLVDTTRGAIKDRQGRILAVDKPCIDACVEYRALTHPPDPDWVRDKALERLHSRFGDAYARMPKKQRTTLRDQEAKAVEADIDAMWAKLAKVSNRSLDEIQEVREEVIRRVQMRQRYVWNKRLEEAMRHEGQSDQDGGTIKRFLANGDDSASDDSLQVIVSEQREPHVILRNIDTLTQNELGKDIDHYPGLVLRPGSTRVYPYLDVACQVLGHMARVDSNDLKLNKKLDELRDYMPNDLIGRSGVEALCEPALRGTRGKVDRVLGEDTVLGRVEPQPGQDVTISIDIELQQQIQAAFEHATLRDPRGNVTESDAILHGAAVVMDVKTNQVLALVSYPTYDLNTLDENYSKLHDDVMNEPLRNRATMSQLEPGSTIKPFCGMAAIAQGVRGVNQGIECRGYLYLDGRKQNFGRCWIASSSWSSQLPSVEHHPVPVPHKGHDGNLDGYLTYSDALERSCNIYFETAADDLHIDLLSAWYERFGLGRPTGIGLAEARGRLPRSFPISQKAQRRMWGLFAGIGQGWVAATPIQMANATAMLARGGIWMRPQLLLPEPDGNLPPVKEDAWRGTPEKLDLHLPPEAVAAAKDGMWRVVYGDAGTGKSLAAQDPTLASAMICGKTGTAQAAKFTIPKRDPKTGRILRDERGRIIREEVQPSRPGEPNPDAPWYRMDENGKIDHAWYEGFAPKDNPRIAFAVMVEYGGSGGVAAAAVAREALEDCIARGYLQSISERQQPVAEAMR